MAASILEWRKQGLQKGNGLYSHPANEEDMALFIILDNKKR